MQTGGWKIKPMNTQGTLMLEDLKDPMITAL